jgi:hypothetical protein
LPNHFFEYLVAHAVEMGLGEQMLLLQVEAVSTGKVTVRPGGFNQDIGQRFCSRTFFRHNAPFETVINTLSNLPFSILGEGAGE